jgi:putative glutamine amidotransferase
MVRPIIGITSGFTQVETIGGALPSHYASTHLAAAVWKAGGLPWLLPSIPDAVSEVSEHLDGLVLGGGTDVDPRRYGEEPLPGIEFDERRDAFEFALVREALDRDIPVLGACRGIQVLAVALGGRLVQDLPRQRPSRVAHLQPLPGNEVHHRVSVKPDSRLAAILSATSLEVNSLHHQGVAEPGPMLKPVGVADDGLVEAAEIPERWVVAVQWHPELLHKARPEALELFRALVAATQNERVKA